MCRTKCLGCARCSFMALLEWAEESPFYTVRYRSPNLRTSTQEQPLTYATAKTLHHLSESRSTYHATRSTSDRCAHFEIPRHWTAFRRSGSGRLGPVGGRGAAALQTLVAGPSLLVRLIGIWGWKSPPIACRRHAGAGGRTSPAQRSHLLQRSWTA
jgi:hypothetical protein